MKASFIYYALLVVVTLLPLSAVGNSITASSPPLCLSATSHEEGSEVRLQPCRENALQDWILSKDFGYVSLRSHPNLMLGLPDGTSISTLSDSCVVLKNIKARGEQQIILQGSTSQNGLNFHHPKFGGQILHPYIGLETTAPMKVTTRPDHLVPFSFLEEDPSVRAVLRDSSVTNRLPANAPLHKNLHEREVGKVRIPVIAEQQQGAPIPGGNILLVPASAPTDVATPSPANILTGHIIDSNGNPLSGVDVSSVSGFSTASQNDGYFELSVKTGSDELQIRAQGFYPINITVHSSQGYIGEVALSPLLPLGSMRIVLVWNTTGDLDAVLQQQLSGACGARNLFSESVSSGLTPETILIRDLNECKSGYSYYVKVHGEKSSSILEHELFSANVDVYNSRGLMHSISSDFVNVAALWHVFDVVSDDVRLVNRMEEL